MPGGRPDRPHTFILHERADCPACGTEVEGRVVTRDCAVVNLLRCPACGPVERPVADDAAAWMAAFLARGENDGVFKQTTSTCATCLALIKADVVIEAGKVYFRKHCATCGPSEALVSEDAEHYVRAYSFARAGTEPLVFGQEANLGCPTDCGTCSDHEQHTCLPIIEITDHCNLECPICIVDNQYSTHMDPDVFSRAVDTLVEAEGQTESLALSGGEPTSHPQILELIDRATRPEIGRVVLITNGLRLGRDRKFAEQLKARDVYVGLQLDGFSAETHTQLRGRDLTREKSAALAMLKDLQIPTQLIFVATRGVNEHELGRAVELLVTEDHILSLNVQPVSYSGQGGGVFDHDPLDRLSIPGAIAAMADQSPHLEKSDFAPLPCSHPQCVSLAYLLRLNDGTYLPFGRFIDFERHGELLRSSATLPASPAVHDALHEVIHDVYAREDEVERGSDILAAMRRTLDVMFPARTLTEKDKLRIGEQQAKSIFIHHYMDRHDFDLERLRKCCHHYLRGDGRIMPACGFNLFHRGSAQGAGTAVAEWGRSPADELVQIT